METNRLARLFRFLFNIELNGALCEGFGPVDKSRTALLSSARPFLSNQAKSYINNNNVNLRRLLENGVT